MINKVQPCDMASGNGETLWAERRLSAQLLEERSSATPMRKSTDSIPDPLSSTNTKVAQSPQRKDSRTGSNEMFGSSELRKSGTVYGSTDKPSTLTSSNEEKSSKQNGFYKMYASAPIKRLKHPVEKNLLVSFVLSLVFLITALVLFCPTFAILILAIPIILICRRLAACCCCCTDNRVCACCCSKMLSVTESQWLHESQFNKMVVQCLVTMESGLDVMRVRDLILARLISAENRRGRRLYPRFTQKIIPVYSGYAWVDDPNFDIDNHVFSMPTSIKTTRDLEAYVGQMAGKEIDLDQPPWDLHIALNVDEDRDTALLFRFHPCLTDGISMLRIFCRSISDLHSSHVLKPRFGGGAIIFNGLRAAIAGPLIFLGKLLQRRDYNILHGPTLSGKKVVAWSDAISFPAAFRVKQVTRSTLNDVIVAAVSGSLRNYMQTRGIPNPYNMRVSIPMDLRTDSNTISMGNHYTMFDIKLPTNTEGSIPRLWETKHNLEELKNSADPVVMYGALHTIMTLLPTSVSQKIISFLNNKMTCVISNMPGPDLPVTFAGRNIKLMVYWMPPRDKVGVSISAMSYADQVRLAVLADEAVMPDPEVVAKDFQHQMENMSILLANRRIPGERRRDFDEDADEEDEVDPLEDEIATPPVRHPSATSSMSRSLGRTSSKSRPLSASLDSASSVEAYLSSQDASLQGHEESMKKLSMVSNFSDLEQEIITVETRSASGTVVTHEQLKMKESHYSPEVERKS